MTTTERAATIRQTLKAKYGWTSRQVSVKSHLYSMGSSIRITIKDPAVPKSVVTAVAKDHESIRWDEYTQEILSGGNRFVFVDYGHEALDAFGAQYTPAVEAALAKLDPTSTGLEPIEGTPFLVGRDKRGLRLCGNAHMGYYYNAEAVAERVGAEMVEAKLAKEGSHA